MRIALHIAHTYGNIGDELVFLLLDGDDGPVGREADERKRTAAWANW
jgi:hypothetical protein